LVINQGPEYHKRFAYQNWWNQPYPFGSIWLLSQGKKDGDNSDSNYFRMIESHSKTISNTDLFLCFRLHLFNQTRTCPLHACLFFHKTLIKHNLKVYYSLVRLGDRHAMDLNLFERWSWMFTLQPNERILPISYHLACSFYLTATHHTCIKLYCLKQCFLGLINQRSFHF